MTIFKSNGDRVPAVIESYAEEVRSGRMDRREFLAMASAMGASTALIGLLPTYGQIGVKTWLYKGERLTPKSAREEQEFRERQPRRPSGPREQRA